VQSAPQTAAHPAELPLPHWEIPTRRSRAVFRAKVMLHQAARGVRDCAAGPRRFLKAADTEFSVVAGQSRTALWSDERPGERSHQLGKVQNLRRAAAALDGVVVPAGEVFSFWRQIGRASRRRGYVVGRMLQQGCLVPAVGGGLCQLSNALYEAALQTGCDIVERHAHSRIVIGSAAALGRDATVAWNYVDLRFRPRRDLMIRARVERDALVIGFRTRRGETAEPARGNNAGAGGISLPRNVANTCATCGETSCFRHEGGDVLGQSDHPTAYLLDENWPELQAYVALSRRSNDVLGLPLDGGRWRLARYRWQTDGAARVGSAPFQTLARALAVRRAPPQGPARRQAELAGSERIAHRLASLLTPEIERVCVAQSLLPFLWRDGHLGGREVSVLMTRLPFGLLQARLDQAWAAHPERRTLGDFRAPAWLVEAEAEALDYAARIVTPHVEIARLHPGRVVELDWKMPGTKQPRRADVLPRRVAFPGPTVARKGAYELREAARALGLEILCLGSEFEGAEFWNGVATCRPDSSIRLDGVAAMVQPALVEERPRHLLAALAAGVPVIATEACGIAARAGVTIVPAGDTAALIAALRATLK
jgi:hypothetical protein